MSTKKLLMLFGIICLVFIVAACAAPAPAPAPNPAPAPAPKPEPVTLKAVSFQPLMGGESKSWIKWVEKTNEAMNGEVIIEVIGGPEVVAGFDQAQAVNRGTIDMAMLPGSYYEGLVPEARRMLTASITPPEVEMTNGFHDLMVQYHAKAGIYYFGRCDVKVDPQFILGFTDKISKPADMKGRKMGVSGVWYEGASPVYGTTMVILPLPDAFTSVERGVVDGYAVPYNTFVTFGLHEALKYYIDHPIYRDNKTIIINSDKWNSIPKSTQDKMYQVYVDMFPELIADFNAINVQGRQQCIDAGGTLVQFSEADAKWFVDIAYEVMWDEVLKVFPEDGPKMLATMK